MKLLKYLQYIIPLLLLTLAVIWSSNCSCAHYHRFWGRFVPEFCFMFDRDLENSNFSLLGYLEGSIGALLMVSSAVAAILFAVFGRYKYVFFSLCITVIAFLVREVCPT